MIRLTVEKCNWSALKKTHHSRRNFACEFQLVTEMIRTCCVHFDILHKSASCLGIFPAVSSSNIAVSRNVELVPRVSRGTGEEHHHYERVLEHTLSTSLHFTPAPGIYRKLAEISIDQQLTNHF